MSAEIQLKSLSSELRHFSRYYFDLDYDWDKLRYLLKKFDDVREPVREQLLAFDDYLHRMVQSDT